MSCSPCGGRHNPDPLQLEPNVPPFALDPDGDEARALPLRAVAVDAIDAAEQQHGFLQGGLPQQDPLPPPEPSAHELLLRSEPPQEEAPARGPDETDALLRYREARLLRSEHSAALQQMRGLRTEEKVAEIDAGRGRRSSSPTPDEFVDRLRQDQKLDIDFGEGMRTVVIKSISPERDLFHLRDATGWVWDRHSHMLTPQQLMDLRRQGKARVHIIVRRISDT